MKGGSSCARFGYGCLSDPPVAAPTTSRANAVAHALVPGPGLWSESGAVGRSEYRPVPDLKRHVEETECVSDFARKTGNGLSNHAQNPKCSRLHKALNDGRLLFNHSSGS